MTVRPERIEKTDFVRYNLKSLGQRKEWQHFVVSGVSDRGARIELLINFNWLGGVHGDAAVVPRLLVIGKIGKDWVAFLDSFNADSLEVQQRSTELQFGNNHVRFDQGKYRVALDIEQFQAELVFEPTVSPLLTIPSPVGTGSIRWLMMPSMLASGRLLVASERYSLDRCSAYHDHNWGAFQWGDNFSWQWGVIFGSEDAPSTSIVVSRVLDKFKQSCLSASIVIAQDGKTKDFRGHEVEIVETGVSRGQASACLPKNLPLVVPQAHTDLPNHISIAARSRRDVLRIEARPIEFALIGLPNDFDSELSLLEEALLEVSVEGRVFDKDLKMNTTGIWEATSVF